MYTLRAWLSRQPVQLRGGGQQYLDAPGIDKAVRRLQAPAEQHLGPANEALTYLLWLGTAM